jgi:hypothetical protein
MLENLEPNKPIRNCKIRTILEQLDETDGNILRDALGDRKKWQDYPLSKALENRGVHVSPNSITKHRAGACSCRFVNA